MTFGPRVEFSGRKEIADGRRAASGTREKGGRSDEQTEYDSTWPAPPVIGLAGAAPSPRTRRWPSWSRVSTTRSSSRSISAARSGTARTPPGATSASTPARPPAPTRPARCRSSRICSTARRQGDRDLAVQRAADGQAAQGEGAEDPGHDDRRRSQQGRRGPAQDLSRHRQLSDGREVRRAPEEAEAGGRHGLPAARQRRRRQHQRSAPPGRATRCRARRASSG